LPHRGAAGGPASSYAPSSFLRQPEPKKLSARRKSFTFPGVIGHQLISDFMYVRRTAELDTLTAMRAYLPLRAVFYVVFSASNRLTRDWRAGGLLSQTKPVVIFRHATKLPAVTNTVLVNHVEKELHAWQQPLSAMRLVARLSIRGALVVDPFVGTGTTGVAALALGRRFLGCDIDAGIVPVARARLAQAVAALGSAPAAANGGEHALPVERYVEAARRVRPPNSSTMAGSACAK